MTFGYHPEAAFAAEGSVNHFHYIDFPYAHHAELRDSFDFSPHTC
jgi:hypothetical protein